jgi:SPP1 gp7 family putative phage head morphogenesis protein
VATARKRTARKAAREAVPFRPVNRILLRYYREIVRLLGDDPTRKVKAHFIEACQRIAARMVRAVAHGHAVDWRTVAQMARSRAIYQGLRRERAGLLGRRLRELVEENARLIHSLPADIARHTAKYVKKRQQQGARAAEIAEELRRRLPELSAARIHLISRTQVAKTSAELTRARSESLGIPAYVWATSRDERVRQSHRNMESVIVFYNDPPSPEALVAEHDYGHYGAGETWNCRCSSLPLVSLDEVTWPHKVYTGGSIRMMTRMAFKRLYDRAA